MAYSDSTGDNAQLLRRTVTGVSEFTGRSRRTEVVYYWIASTILGVTVNFAVRTVAPSQTSLLFGYALQLMLLVPMFALFVRRLHDQDKSGWWGMLLPLSVLLSIPSLVAEVRGDFSVIIDQQTSPIGIAAGVCFVAVVILCFWQGTEGPNRYGPDPRLEEV